MDIATVIGLFGALGIVAMAMIMAGGFAQFVDGGSILIVVLGSHLVVMGKFPLGDFLGAVKGGLKTLFFKSPNYEEIIAKVVELADLSRKGGLLSLEGAQIDEAFMKKGVGLLVDGHDGEVVKSILEKDVSMACKRHETGIAIFKSLGDVAPAMGMIGTLVGLVAMLGNMDDPKSIGPSMAIALLTTLYGAMIANMMALPISEKLAIRNEEEKLSKTLMIDGLLGIQAGQNPRVIEQVLMGYLAEGSRPAAEE